MKSSLFKWSPHGHCGRYTWGLMALQLLSFVGIIMIVEPRRVRLLKEHVAGLLESHEGKTHEQV